MKTTIEKWSIKKLHKNLSKIDDQPLYQRGKVWSKMKNQLLIDSIFRGIDIPKIYLRRINHNGFEYEIADGQQRINAINKFLNDDLSIYNGVVNGLELSIINDIDFGNKKINDIRIIDPKLVDFFENEYPLTIAIIDDVSNSEIRTLFGRLQEGSKLNPAEKRNAILSQIGTHIDNFAFNHLFFESSKIPVSRYRHQDYLAHIFALIIFENKFDLKANLMEKLYLKNVSVFPSRFLHNISLVLDKMNEIDTFSKVKIRNKFSFIDIFYYLFVNIKQLDNVNSEKFAIFYDQLERMRILRKNEPELLLKDKIWGKSMYNYIIAYKSLGYEPENISIRLSSLSQLFNKFKI